MTDTSTQVVTRMAQRHTLNDDEAETLRDLSAERDRLATAHVQLQRSLDDANARAKEAEYRIVHIAAGLFPGGFDNNVAAIRAALRDKPAPEVTVERVQHIKRGTTYQIVARGKLQTDTPLNDYAELVAYRCEASGDVWFRPQSEFTPDRFRAIAGGGDE